LSEILSQKEIPVTNRKVEENEQNGIEKHG
jgi:hypothetical protein